MAIDDRSDEELFERFRRDGDAAALGALFDRTSSALLRVALHLTRDPSVAEDLVQSTFLRAIEVRATWDGDRPLLPWLCGVLQNRARHERWHAGRVPDPERLVRAAPVDPLQTAIGVEFDAALDAAIADLPEAYRAVLRLHLAYGHAPAEIAHALDRPAGTVRSQLARGLARLRAVLPVGFAGVVAVALPGRGLAAVRAVVVDHAARAVPFAVVGSVGGLLGMKKVVGIVLLVCVAVGGWFVEFGDVGDPVRAAEPMPSQRSAAVTDAGGATGRFDPRSERQPVDIPAATVDATAAGPGSIVVRAHRVGDATPVAGVVVMRGPADEADRAEEAVRTDAAGVARFLRVAPGRHRLMTGRISARIVTVTSGLETVVDLALRQPGSITGTVVDAGGAPVPGADVLGVPDYLTEGVATLARTDAAGRFAADLVALNTQLFARKAGHGTSSAIEHVSFAGEVADVQLVLPRDARTVRGVVVGDDGRPVARAELYLEPFQDVPSPGVPTVTIANWTHAVADDDGRFVVVDVPRGSCRACARAEGFAPVSFVVPAQAAGHDDFVTVRLARGGAVFGRVIDRDGAPVADALVWLQILAPWGAHRIRTAADGSYRLDGVDCGVDGQATQVTLHFEHESAGRCSAAVVVHRGGVAELDATLRPLDALVGSVRRADGSPLEGREVVLTHRDGTSQHAWTDADGRFRVEFIGSDAAVLAVQDIGPYPAAQLARVENVRGGGAPLEIVVPDEAWPTAYLHGRFVRPSGYESALIRLQYWEETSHWSAVEGVSPDGTFRFGPLSPGTYRGLVISYRSPLGGGEFGPIRVGPHDDVDLGAIAIAAPVVVELVPRMPADFDVDMLSAELRDENGVVARLDYERGETHASRDLLPGHYTLVVSPGFGFAGRELPCEIVAGPPNRIPFDLVPLRRVRVSVVDAGGQPIAAAISLEITPATTRGAVVRTFEGRANLSLAAGHYALTAADGGRHARAEFDVDAPTGDPLRVELRLK